MITNFFIRLISKMLILHFSYLSWQAHEFHLKPSLVIVISFSLIFLGFSPLF